MKTALKPIKEHSFTFSEGFTLLANKPVRPEGMRQVDWDTVKTIIESGEFEQIEVGLAEDYAQTSAVIYEDGKITITENDGGGFYGASRWATPAVKLFKNGTAELFECWISGGKFDFPSWLTNKEA